MRWRSHSGFAFLLGLVASHGCSGPSYTETNLSPGIIVRCLHPDAAGGDTGVNRPDEEFAECVFHWEGAEHGKVDVVVEKLPLRIDGKDYGSVASGDHVVIDATIARRRVSVNGVDRE